MGYNMQLSKEQQPVLANIDKIEATLTGMEVAATLGETQWQRKEPKNPLIPQRCTRDLNLSQQKRQQTRPGVIALITRHE